jgi:hypothetical protein
MHNSKQHYYLIIHPCMLGDVKGAFLFRVFAKGERIYMEIPQGFEKYYPKNAVLLLLKTIYGLKQAALAFWRDLLGP